MPHRHPQGRACVLAGLLLTLSCAVETPTEPAALAPQYATAAATGRYELFFRAEGGRIDVTSAPIHTGIGLGARVWDASGTPAQGGAVTFQYCSVAGGEPAPKEACETGSGRWRNHGTSSDLSCRELDGAPCPGSILYFWGACSTPRSIGFRFKFAQKRTSIASHTTPAANFEWTPL